MYKDYWRLQRVPFDNTPDPDFLFNSRAHTEAIAQLLYVVEANKGAGLLTGEFGSGKTLLSRSIAQRLLGQDGYEVALITHPSLNPEQMLKELFYQLTEEDAADEKQTIIHRLHDYLYAADNAGKTVVVMIDEAQAMEDKDVLEELRMLLNFQLNDKFLITLLFFGQPELRDRVDRYPQLKQRLAIRFHLSNLHKDEVGSYIAHRMTVAGADPKIFTPGAIGAVCEATAGCPREINNVCDMALYKACQKNLPRVEAETIADVVNARESA